MAKVQKPCKTCGKMFTPCTDCERDKTMFHWRTVACSLECAKAYFAKVEEARKPINKVQSKSVKNTDTVINNSDFVEDSTNIKPKKTRKYNNVKNEEESE